MSIILTILLILTNLTSVNAIDGEVYMGKFFSNHNRSAPMDYDIPIYEAGVLVGETFGKFRFYTEIITLMEYKTNSLFHPTSVEYIIGADLNLYKTVTLTVEHSCWHPVDEEAADYMSVEDYNIIKFRYKF